jgi:hypothetical protein
VRTYLNIVSNLDEIIKLDTFLNYGVSKGTTVYACVCSNLNLIADANIAELLYFDPTPLMRRKSKAICANHYTWMYDAI